MISIIITNPSNLFPNRFITQSTSFAYNKLFKNKNRDIHVEFNFTNMDDNTTGYFNILDGGRWPEYFSIEISNNIWSRSELYKTIFHEMVHVSQAHSGRFFLLENENIRYNKRIYNVNEYYSCEFPWELEAYDLEEKIYNSFEEYMNLTDNLADFEL